MASLGRQVLTYSLLPGILPRVYRLLGSGFGLIAYLMAVIYQAMRLLPDNHVYLNPQNIGRFGLRHVIAAAADNLVIRKKNADQVIVFFTILVGIVLLFLQVILFVIALVSQQPALAASVQDLFQVTSQYNVGPGQDLAFIMMDRVFGTVGIFGSCISDTAIDCVDLRGNVIPSPATYPMPFHTALHLMLQFYSNGIFIVCVMVILYLITTIVAETASTGTPFGQRYNKAWMPVRLIFFFALLVPLNIGQDNSGLNAAQLITFWAAKTGSNFATNTWGKFNQDLANNTLLDSQSLVATPNIPEIGELNRFMFLAKVCKIAEEIAYKPNSPYIRPYLVRENRLFGGAVQTSADFLATPFQDAMRFSDYGTISIVIGERDEDKYQGYRGFVKPTCGEIKFNIIDVDEGGSIISGSSAIQEIYYNIVQDMWTDPLLTPPAACVVRKTFVTEEHQPDCPFWPDQNFIQSQMDTYRTRLENEIPDAIQQQIDNGEWNVPQQLLDKGWAGASIWYNRIAEANGDVTTAALNLPIAHQYPDLMEKIAFERSLTDENITATNVFDPILANKQEIDYPRYKDSSIAQALYVAYLAWETGDMASMERERSSNNIIIDAIHLIFGTSGIYDIRRNTEIHPLAQLSSLGKTMMEASVRNLAIGIVGSGASKIFKDFVGPLGSAASSFLFNMGVLMISLSFVLYYVVPFLPFLFFFFAVGAWVKSIFEAIVAMPLWAMAHLLRIDGEGLPGPWAANGYFLLFEIFLRPILILFGFIASISVFTAMIVVLNEIFDLVIANVGGFDIKAENSGNYASLNDYLRGPVDQFFYTAVYVILIYMIGNSCFKMIDMVPDQILRYMGVTVKAFQEIDKGLAESVVQKTYSAGMLASGKLRGGALAAIVG